MSLIRISLYSSAIIHDLLQRFNSAAAYFFFDGRDSQKDFQLHDKLIRSLIWQFSLKCEGRVPKVLVNLYAHCGNGHQEPALGDLQIALQRILHGFSCKGLRRHHTSQFILVFESLVQSGFFMPKGFNCNHNQSAFSPEVTRPDWTAKRLQTMVFCHL